MEVCLAKMKQLIFIVILSLFYTVTSSLVIKDLIDKNESPYSQQYQKYDLEDDVKKGEISHSKVLKPSMNYQLIGHSNHSNLRINNNQTYFDNIPESVNSNKKNLNAARSLNISRKWIEFLQTQDTKENKNKWDSDTDNDDELKTTNEHPSASSSYAQLQNFNTQRLKGLKLPTLDPLFFIMTLGLTGFLINGILGIISDSNTYLPTYNHFFCYNSHYKHQLFNINEKLIHNMEQKFTDFISNYES